jgi:hypothetical protein
MNTEKFLENLKYEARSFALWDKHLEANLLDAVIRALEDALDKVPVDDYSSDNEETPF